MGVTYSSCKTSAEAVTQLTSTVTNNILTDNSTMVSSANLASAYCTDAATETFAKVCINSIDARQNIIVNMQNNANTSNKILTNEDYDRALKWIPIKCDFCNIMNLNQKDFRVVKITNTITNKVTSDIKMQAEQDIDSFLKNKVEGKTSAAAISVTEAANRVKSYLKSEDFTKIVTNSLSKIPGQNTATAINGSIINVTQELATQITVTNITDNIVTTNKNIMSDIQSMLDFDNEVTGQDWAELIQAFAIVGFAIIGIIVALIIYKFVGSKKNTEVRTEYITKPPEKNNDQLGINDDIGIDDDDNDAQLTSDFDDE